MSDKPLPYLALACGLAAAIVTLLFWTNAGYLFHTPLYENGDPGANSLSVLRAEKFHEIYGAYSRWEFHHPGPALFCSSAWGELLFYQALHLTPTGYNAQVMVVVILTASFLAGGISVAARWVRSRVFVPLALLVAALHFTAVVPLYCFFGTWTPFVMPMLFVALLTAAASVAAGQGQDLPLLVLACGFLVHIHVAQPFFVVPIFTLAYLRLLWVCRRSSALAPLRPASAWRRYPWAHGFAAVLLAVFVLPILVDVCRGNDSNLARIVDHLRNHRGENHPWLDAINCFLRFGSYVPSHNLNAISLGNVVWPQIGNYLVGHAKMMLIWVGGVTLAAGGTGGAAVVRQPTFAREDPCHGRRTGSLALSRLVGVLLRVGCWADPQVDSSRRRRDVLFQ